MKTEDHAWRALQNHASAQLHRGFADRVLRAAQGPQPETWRQLQAHAAGQLRPGFAERVMRAARAIPGVPSLLDQLAFSVGTAAVCAVAAFFFHQQSVQREEAANLARWQQVARIAVDEEPHL